MSRKALLTIVAVIGIGLALAPVAFQMFSRAPKGAAMLTDFKPFMTTERLDGFQKDIGEIDSAVREVDTKAVPQLHATDPKHAAGALASYQDLQQQWPQIDSTMTDLLDKVQDNLGNYQAMAALPSFRLFPWFFVIPGVLMAALAIAGLLGALPPQPTRIGLAVIGIALILAPVATQMFDRAPKGADMMSTFKQIETPQKIGQIQQYFSTMAVGQGAIRNDIVPALRSSGVSQAALAADYPSITALDADWVHILNDMTPMIGAMSDSLPRFQAISSLPSFMLFPWFFVVPGALVFFAAIAAGAPPQRRPDTPAEASVATDPVAA
ncbi:MAG TPA: hypothetical protein VHB69_01255 [Mycobacteriales bacterium]|nr:hypothetical protein [Mycobacteriales bacterium]